MDGEVITRCPLSCFFLFTYHLPTTNELRMYDTPRDVQLAAAQKVGKSDIVQDIPHVFL
jgi:hypothetical protein